MDVADRSNVDKELLEQIQIDAIRKAAADIPKGVEGTCEFCGYFFTRIVNNHCGKCRDELHLK